MTGVQTCALPISVLTLTAQAANSIKKDFFIKMFDLGLIKQCFNSETVIKNCVANIEIIPLPLTEFPLMFINFGNFCLFF